MNQNKHYNTLTEYFKEIYPRKVPKIPSDANFTCPNKDGRKGYGGCSYCSKLGSGDTAGDVKLPLKEQYQQIKEKISKKWPNPLCIPFLQANSNTYAPIENLKAIYEEIINLDKENIVKFAIATRPDCFSEELYSYLEEFNQRVPLSIELGLQTANEQTAKAINRCSTNQEFIDCVQSLRKRKIQVVVHIINGLPGETKEDMLATIDFINTLDIQGIKFHMLLILKDTPLYQQYLKKPFPLLSLEEYVTIVTEQIARLKPSMIVHRLGADGIPEDIYAPLWPMKKLVVMNEIDKRLRKENIFQGDKFNLSSHHH